jgi:hypothetical protein
MLSDDHQHHIRNDIEDQENDFKQPEERVNDYVEGFPGNRKPFALRALHEIRGYYQHYCPENQQASVHNGTPHKERGKCLNIHDVPPFFASNKQLSRYSAHPFADLIQV